MDREDLTAFDAPPPASTSTSDVLRKFDQETSSVAKIVLSLLIVAAAALGCEEVVQTECVRQSIADTVTAADQPHGTQLTSIAPPETVYGPVETPGSNSSSPRALSSQSNPIDTEITVRGQRSLAPVEELAEPKSKSLINRTSTHHKLADVKNGY